MKRAKWSDIPKDYRRNYKEEIVEALKLIACGALFGAVLLLIVAIGL